MMVKFFKHNLGNREQMSVQRVLRSLFLTTGENVEEFEKVLSRYLSVGHSIGLMSCTGALHLALVAAGVKKGDEVITTPMSFIATANVILMAGATPVFVDVEPETGNINSNLIEAAITKRTKAILPVHLYGQMADMKKISKIAREYSLHVIEDAAHALESKRDGVRPGQLSFAACFSFYATKSITSGEGGALVTNSATVARLTRQLRSHGITSELAQRERAGVKKYDADILGWKYNMSNIQAALLVPQMKGVESRRRRREEIAALYERGFANLTLKMPKTLPRVTHGRHIFPIWVQPSKRDAVLEYLTRHSVEAVINYPPIHLFSFYRKQFGFSEGDFPIAERIGASTISLPLYSKLTDKEADYVIMQVKNALQKS
jgi:dTDP-4-amino-4,6-dideoxygalactose transaminase